MTPGLWAVVVAAAITCADCVPGVRMSPDLDSPPMMVTIRPAEVWTDTGIIVHQGEWLFFTACGELFWQARDATAGPDGIDGGLGWYIGAGGLIGRVGTTSKPFDIGARTHPFQVRNLRSRREFPPPPIRMEESGRLFLGFKGFTAGSNRGTFEITIRPVRN